MLKHRYFSLGVCGVAFLAWYILLFYKYTHFGYYDWDLAFFTQACWQLLHGSQFSSIAGINYFGDHSYFITLLILPFFALAPHPLTLILLKLIAFLVAAYLFYKIVDEALGPQTALVLMVLYIIFPANIFSMLYEFNPESFAPPILFWMFVAFDKQRWKSFFAAAILLMSIKENMALIVCMFGVYAFLNKAYTFKIAWRIFLGGAVVFVMLVFYLVPYFRHLPQHAFVVRYGYLGHSVGEILYHIVTRPDLIAAMLFNGVNIHYIQELFGVLLVPALIGWWRLFLAIPLLLQHLLSTHPPEHSIYYHYGATISPFIFLATMQALMVVRQKMGQFIFGVILFLLTGLSIFQLFSYSQEFSVRLDYHRDRLDAIRWSFISAVPRQEGVIATFDYLSPLSLRKDLYAFHKVYNEYYQNFNKIKLSELNTTKPFVLPENVHYALIDFKDPWLLQAYTLNSKETSGRLKAFLQQYHWKLIKSYGSIVLLKR